MYGIRLETTGSPWDHDSSSWGDKASDFLGVDFLGARFFSLTAATAVGIRGREVEITVRVTESLRKSKLGLWVLSFSSSSSAGERWEEEEEETVEGGRGFGWVLVRGIGLGYGDREEDEPRREWQSMELLSLYLSLLHLIKRRFCG